MMSAIISFLGAIPMMIKAYFSVLEAINAARAREQAKKLYEEQKRREDAIEAVKRAQTPEDVWKANEEISRNLP